MDAPKKFGHYRVIEVLGEGTQARVYSAEDQRDGSRCALKVFRDAKASQSALREASIAAAIDHPNIVRIFAVGALEGRTYISMELLGRGNLEARRRAGRLAGIEAGCLAATAAARGLQAAHRRGVLHRDVKPTNLLFGRDGSIKLADFGLASMARARKRARVGTPGYMAPEVRREGRARPGSDVYGLGATLGFALFGEPPAGPNDRRLVQLPARLAELLRHCLDDVPEARPSAAEVARSLLGMRLAGGRGPAPSPEVDPSDPVSRAREQLRRQISEEGLRADRWTPDALVVLTDPAHALTIPKLARAAEELRTRFGLNRVNSWCVAAASGRREGPPPELWPDAEAVALHRALLARLVSSS